MLRRWAIVAAVTSSEGEQVLGMVRHQVRGLRKRAAEIIAEEQRADGDRRGEADGASSTGPCRSRWPDDRCARGNDTRRPSAAGPWPVPHSKARRTAPAGRRPATASGWERRRRRSWRAAVGPLEGRDLETERREDADPDHVGNDERGGGAGRNGLGGGAVLHVESTGTMPRQRAQRQSYLLAFGLHGPARPIARITCLESPGVGRKIRASMKRSFWSLIVVQVQVLLNDNAAKLMLMALGVAVAPELIQASLQNMSASTAITSSAPTSRDDAETHGQADQDDPGRDHHPAVRPLLAHGRLDLRPLRQARRHRPEPLGAVRRHGADLRRADVPLPVAGGLRALPARPPMRHLLAGQAGHHQGNRLADEDRPRHRHRGGHGHRQHARRRPGGRRALRRLAAPSWATRGTRPRSPWPC